MLTKCTSTNCHSAVARMMSVVLWNVPVEFNSARGLRSNQYGLWWYVNVVLLRCGCALCIRRCPQIASIMKKIVSSPCESMHSSIREMRYESCYITAFDFGQQTKIGKFFLSWAQIRSIRPIFSMWIHVCVVWAFCLFSLSQSSSSLGLLDKLSNGRVSYEFEMLRWVAWMHRCSRSYRFTSTVIRRAWL